MNKTKIKRYSKKVVNFTKDNIWYLVGVGLGIGLYSAGHHVGFKKGMMTGTEYKVVTHIYDKNQDIPNE